MVERSFFRNHHDSAQIVMHLATDTIVPLGDAAVRIDCGEPDDPATATRVTSLGAALQADRCSGVTDVVLAYSTIVVHYDPIAIRKLGTISPYQFFADWVRRCVSRISAIPPSTKQSHVIPVVYDDEFAPDLKAVAEHCGLAIEEVIRRHCEAVYTVRAIGFTPGFPYLDGLPAELATPRRATPRTSVPAGSVGIGGSQTGVYPLASPGGWNLIGRTPLRLLDARCTPAALLRLGDTVQFRRIQRMEFDSVARTIETKPVQTPDSESFGPVFDVLQSGLQTTIQDLGRSGHQAEGVTPGGAMDALAARVANLLVGNAENTPLLEAVLRGPVLQLAREALIAVTGATVPGISGWRPLHVAKGQTFDCTATEAGARIYIAVAGGIAADHVLNGCGTDLNAGFGGHHGRAVVAGDQLCLAAVSDPQVAKVQSPKWFASPQNLAPRDPHGRIRILRGPQSNWCSDAAWTRFLCETFAVSPNSNRMGIRLSGPAIDISPREMTSEPVVFGAVQIPPDGQPIVLAADRQTIGGYPVIACVITADRSQLAQLRPGNEVRFSEVTLAAAEALSAQCERNIATLKLAIQRLS